MSDTNSKAAALNAQETKTVNYEYRKDELFVFQHTSNTVKAALDLNDDNIIITDSRLRKGQYKLCEYRFKKHTKKEVSELNRLIKCSIDGLDIICKSTVAKTYGKDIADKAPVYQYVDNPYYKCAPEMQLYIKQSLDHLYGYHTLVRWFFLSRWKSLYIIGDWVAEAKWYDREATH